MTSFAFATSVLSAAVLLLARPVDASSTEYKCSGGEYCKLSSNENICTPIGQGLPSGNNFMPSLMGSGASTPMPYDCIGISTDDLAESGGFGGCVVTCPDSCTVTPNVASPCTGSTPPDEHGNDDGHGHDDEHDDEHDDMDDPTSDAQGTKSVALASTMIGAVVANIML